MQANRATFDKGVRHALSLPTSATESKGEWLRNLVALSVAELSEKGSTTLAVATLIGQSLTYLNVGDCAVMLFRFNDSLGNRTKLNNGLPVGSSPPGLSQDGLIGLI